MAVRVGVIGAGAYAQRAHLPSLGKHPDVELRAVCRRNLDRLTEVAETFGIPDTYASYSDLIQNEALNAVTEAAYRSTQSSTPSSANPQQHLVGSHFPAQRQA